jgi:hypothetical protein
MAPVMGKRVTAPRGSGIHCQNVGLMPSGCQRPLPRAALGSHIFPPFLAHLDLAAPGSKESCMNRAKPTETTSGPRKPIPAAAERALAEAAARRAARDAAQRPDESQGRDGPDPVRYGDWEVKGIASDF